ncbi:MAG TPA: Crp/Fnr family transcriptional regulator [Chitinophagaceae bacterium]
MLPVLTYLNRYHQLSSTSEEALSTIFSEVKIKKNEILQPIGHTCKTIYFINKGLARIYYLKDGIDITESFTAENNLIARVESLFTGRPSTKAIQVLEDTDLTAINATKLFKLYDQFHDIERVFRKIFEAGYVETINRIESIQFHTAEERYRSLLHEAPDILKRVPLKYIASYLGITQVSLSRIRASH